MNYNNSAALECATPMQPALKEIHNKLQNCVDRFDSLTLDLNNKLQAIQRYNEPCGIVDDVKEKQPDCVVDEINILISRIINYNDRIEESLRHLNQII